MRKTDQWTQISNENGIQLLYQQTSDLTCFKAECSFEGNPLNIFNFCADVTRRSEWDVVVQSATTVEKIDASNDIVHLSKKKCSRD